MSLDIVICTYNRSIKVNFLVKQILHSQIKPSKIIVVDATDVENKFLKNYDKITYLRSSYKAQPYQRYVGLLATNSEYVIFLDDDLDILIPDVFEEILSVFKKNNEIVGVTARVEYESGLFVQKEFKSYSIYLGIFRNIFQIFSLNAKPKPGSISLGGNGGGYIKNNSSVEYFPGPNMAFKREIAFKLFDQSLFAAYVIKIGKGEDKYLSIKANIYGKLYCLGEKCYFHHPPIVSSYNSNLLEFQSKQSYSRFLIMSQYLKTFCKTDRPAIFIYLWYSLFRLVGSLNNIDRFKGVIRGMFYVFKYGTDHNKICPNVDFFEKARIDKNQYKFK